ncbi:MAG: hypothetical protein JWM99_295 [Verrucomicrobiales bacterium]|jgi:hypothetical protein|nr:hypothetical protein [Verrucomicrobiales bacterium]
MKQEIPIELQNELNQRVLKHIANSSAHSDLGEALLTALKPLGDVQPFCPDWSQCRYVVASTRGIIFAFATGMQAIAFRLDKRMKSRAVLRGGASIPECGDEWVSFMPFESDWPDVDLEFWARKAYVAAREREI